jgi:hypothetical protein
MSFVAEGWDAFRIGFQSCVFREEERKERVLIVSRRNEPSSVKETLVSSTTKDAQASAVSMEPVLFEIFQ